MAGMPMMPGFTEADLRGLAGPRSFERGLDYVSQVADLDVTDTEITATVSGTDDYDVCLVPGDQGLQWDCTCPFGQEGFFCKHCVAVGLAVLAPDARDEVSATRARRDSVDAWLESLSRADLAAELRALLDGDHELRRRFELRAAAARGDTLAIRRTTRELITPRRGYLAGDEAGSYCAGVYAVAAAVDDLARAGAGEQAIQAAREAIGELGRAFERLDDSTGSVGAAARQLLAAHLRACRAAPPEPASLAHYLARLALHDRCGIMPDLGDYADLLGAAGLRRLREQVTAAGASTGNPADRPLMESLLRAEGNLDGLIGLRAANLDDYGWQHLAIAHELDQAGRGDEALTWAERGVREAKRPDGRLVEYLADRYAAAGRADDVLTLRRDRFAADSTLTGYQRLRQAATAAGRWPAEREQALALLTATARAPHSGAGRGLDWTGPVLVDALLDDGEADAAWTAAAEVPDATSPAQWLRLADEVAAARPADALEVYRRLIEPLRSRTGDKIYESAARLLRSARACHQALGTTAEFDRYLALFRADQKRKPNLMRLLDRHGLQARRRAPGIAAQGVLS
jgi:SWIM zinc finger